mgnify:CR=1 FL=1
MLNSNTCIAETNLEQEPFDDSKFNPEDYFEKITLYNCKHAYLVPISLLIPTRAEEHYNINLLKKLGKAFRRVNRKEDYRAFNPIECFVHEGYIYIRDGHHRGRAAGICDYKLVPATFVEKPQKVDDEVHDACIASGLIELDISFLYLCLSHNARKKELDISES